MISTDRINWAGTVVDGGHLSLLAAGPLAKIVAPVLGCMTADPSLRPSRFGQSIAGEAARRTVLLLPSIRGER